MSCCTANLAFKLQHGYKPVAASILTCQHSDCFYLLMCCMLQVVEAKSNKLISRCSRLAATATPQQQAAARAAANDMAAAVVALQNTAGQEQPQQQQQAPWATTASTPFGFSDMQSSMSVTEAFKLSSRPGSKFKIVLDFDGNVLQDSLWNVIQETDKIVTQPYDKDGNPRTFNAEEIAGDERGSCKTVASTAVADATHCMAVPVGTALLMVWVVLFPMQYGLCFCLASCNARQQTPGKYAYINNPTPA